MNSLGNSIPANQAHLQVDCKSADLSPTPGATSGTDFAGIVVALGCDVDKDQWQLGDRVMGGQFGNNPLRHDNGAFAEYVAITVHLVWRIPASMDFATAASLPAALATCGLAFFQYMRLPMPDVHASSLQLDIEKETSGPTYVLVYGGGTATGAMALQILKLLGLTPITTCSPNSAARSLELGAVVTFDCKWLSIPVLRASISSCIQIHLRATVRPLAQLRQ